jgi:hypothetical protein
MEEITEAEIRARLRAEVEVLKRSRNRLADLQAAIPPSPQETSAEDDLGGNLDLPTEIRTVIEIQLKENFKALLKSLRAAADYQPAAAAPRAPANGLQPKPVRLDLRGDAETVQPMVYALVVRDHFAARASEEEPGEVWIPPCTAQEAGLLVWDIHGRWFARWRKPDVPEDAPEDEHWEVLLIEEDENEPGSLFYREL